MNTIQIRHRKNLVDFYNADLSIGVALDAGNLDGAADLIEEITDLLVGPARDLVKLRHSLRENGHTNGVESLTGLVQAYAEALETFERRVVEFGKLRRATPKTEATGPGLVKDADDVNTLTHITLMDDTRIRTYTLLLPCTEATALLKDIMGDQGSLTGLEIEARLMDHEATLRPADAKPAGKQARLVVDVQRWSIWRSKLDDVDKLR
jgi:hypothetical protein